MNRFITAIISCETAYNFIICSIKTSHKQLFNPIANNNIIITNIFGVYALFIRI